MKNPTETTNTIASILENGPIHVGEKTEMPTREEFYTNYPFFKYWKKDSNDKLHTPDPINIYIHIPFCKQICDFCFYMKELVKSTAQVDQYIDSLCKEMELASEIHGLKTRKVASVYIGGGTPSILNQKQYNKLMESLYKHHAMDAPEFTFEAEPGTFSNKKLLWYKDSGVNRISMGVQSFVDKVIELSNRKHTAEQAIRSIQMVRDAGQFSINIDLLSGLAGESMDSWARTIDIALEQGVDMLTIYKMKAYANTTFFNKGVRNDEIVLPSEEEEIQFMAYALDKLAESDYQMWTTFAFTKDTYLHTYVENTWRGDDLFSYGSSAFGKIGKISYQNTNNISLYNEQIHNNKLPVYRTFPLSVKDEIVKELLLCGVRLASYSKKEFVRKFGFDYFHLIPETLEELRKEKYILEDSDELRLTRKGVLFGDFVGKVLASSIKESLGRDTIGFTY